MDLCDTERDQSYTKTKTELCDVEREHCDTEMEHYDTKREPCDTEKGTYDAEIETCNTGRNPTIRKGNVKVERRNLAI